TWSRANALMTMSSPLGTDVLIPISLAATEAISQPFQFDVTAVSQSGVVDPNSLLNQPACITLQVAGTPVRYFHGIVQSLSAEGTIRSDADAASFQVYHLRLVPTLWFLTQTTDCRVYEQMSAGDIIESMFTDASLTDYNGPPSSTTRQYTIQYNETDLHFATRLMEEEGWYYFFQHSDSSHTLVIANQNSSFQSTGGTLYIVGGADANTQLLDFNLSAATVRGKMTLADYEPVSPTSQLQSSQPTVLQTGGASTRDDFRWPTAVSYTNESGTDPSANASDNINNQGTVVSNRANWEMQAAEAVSTLYDGSSQFGGMVAGGQFTIASQPASDYDDTYVVRSVTHHASDDTWLNQGGAATYSNSFVAFSSDTTWRQPIVTPRPRMHGVYTALVMGPQTAAGTAPQVQNTGDGAEIYTDDMARVKVRFYWDWRAGSTGSDAVWARVIQPWAGKGWGAQFLPRVGTEVAVAFVDGDPDRPIVIGGLYNGAHAPIYLSTDKNKSGLRSRSTMTGSTAQFHELTFDDTKGSELIFMHSEKDMLTEVENNQTLTVGIQNSDNSMVGNRVVSILNNETVDIQNNQTITVKQDRDVVVTDGNSTYTVSKGTHTETIQGDSTFEVKQGNHTVKIDQGNQSVTVSQGNNSVTVSTGNNSLTVSTGNHSETVSTGNYSISVSAGQMSVNAMQGIQLTCGPCSIQISPSGITISGPQISLSADGQGSFDGGGMLSLTGGMVSINS
ncbi:MAG TPA: type VI secretion system tip protein TssI/VgrG, partial [Acetobacteraceae bacterium]|nr:type VI secretion system tip protein TssI/VgrG [Acetobacteraceae bacterium]